MHEHARDAPAGLQLGRCRDRRRKRRLAQRRGADDGETRGRVDRASGRPLYLRLLVAWRERNDVTRVSERDRAANTGNLAVFGFCLACRRDIDGHQLARALGRHSRHQRLRPRSPGAGGQHGAEGNGEQARQKRPEILRSRQVQNSRTLMRILG